MKVPSKLSLISVHDFNRDAYDAYYEIVVDQITNDWTARVYHRKETVVAGVREEVIPAQGDIPEQHVLVPNRIGKVLAEKSGKASSEDAARKASQEWVAKEMEKYRRRASPGTLNGYAIPLPIPLDLFGGAPFKRFVRRAKRRLLDIFSPLIQVLAYSSTIRNNMLTQIVNAIDGGAGAGLWRIYDGTRPATGGTATTLLAELTCSDPCGTVSAGVLTFSAITADTFANATGTATWFRIVDSAGTFCVDGSVSTSGSDLNLNSTSISSGQEVSITSATITEGNA